MHASPVSQRGTHGAHYGIDYEPSEREVDQLLTNARATAALCVVFLMVLVVL
jgi:Fe-S cluster assembly iron-binding protein IscA